MNRRRVGSWAIVVLTLLGILQLNCSVNILEEFGDPATNEALLFDAKQLINKGSYDAALAKFAEMSTTFLEKREVKQLHASAHLGACSGIDFLGLVTALNALGATRVMVWLMQTFTGGNATRQAHCQSAETILQSIGTFGADRSADENLIMAFVALAKMGNILSRYGDAGVPDGVVDAGFDPCSAADLPSADAKEIATGLNIAMDALENIGTSTIGAGVLTDVTTVCAALPPGYLPLCADPPQVEVVDIDSNEEKGIRSIINESQDFGLGVCTGDAAACACP